MMLSLKLINSSSPLQLRSGHFILIVTIVILLYLVIVLLLFETFALTTRIIRILLNAPTLFLVIFVGKYSNIKGFGKSVILKRT